MTLIATVLIASLLGSVHCAAMCGAFTCVYATRTMTRSFASHAAYHAGRLTSYAALGAGAGALGGQMNDLALMAGIGRGAAVAGGTILAAWAIARLPGTRAASASSTPDWMARVIGALLRRTPARSPVSRAAALGLLTTLIPCGWLYAFTATAATAANPLMGAIVMAVFWIGTVPALLAVAVGARRLAGASSQRLVTASTVAVLVIGLLAVSGRLRPPALQHAHAGAIGAR